MDGKIVTLSGRVIDLPIQRITKSNQGIVRNLRSVDSWLVKQAKKEAGFRNDSFNGGQFEGMEPKNITPAERDVLNVYLFGQEETSLIGE